MRRFVIPALILVALAGTGAAAQQAVPGAMSLSRWDGNGDGRVTLGEVRAGRTAMFATYDVNGDGALSAAEFGAYGPQGLAVRGTGGAMRYGLDGNGDGYVSRKEFIDGSALWLRQMDRNGDGVLTAADFGQNARGFGQGAGQGRGAGPRWNNG